MEEFLKWLMGGGAVALIGLLLKANTEMRQLKLDAAKARTETEAQRAREAQFEASIAESSTKVAGEGILKGLLSTLTQREQNALGELRESREVIGGMREEIAIIKEAEGVCQEALRHMQISQMNLEATHAAQLRALHDKIYVLNGRIYDMGQRMLRAGGAFTATDIVPDHDIFDR